MSERHDDSIPLKTDDPTLTVWKERRDTEGDPRREPGLLNLHRYNLQLRGQGIATFYQQPIALTQEDLKAAGVDVAIMGAGVDQSYGMRGAAYGPRAMRAMDMYLPAPQMGASHAHVMVDPFSELTICDYGDAAIDPESAHRSVEPVRELVREIAETGAIPFIVGGDHSLMYSDVMAITDVYGKGNVGVIHFDTHYDASSIGLGHHVTHGRPVRNLIEEGYVRGENFIQVGLRGYSPGPEDLAWMREQKMRYHFMAEVERHGWDHVLERALAEAKEGTEYLYISLDVDVLDPGFMPGTGTPEPAGLTPRELFPLLRRLCAEANVVGMEVVELNPLVDPTYVSPQLANRCGREMLTGVAMRKKGLTEPHYLSPDTVDHGQGDPSIDYLE